MRRSSPTNFPRYERDPFFSCSVSSYSSASRMSVLILPVHEDNVSLLEVFYRRISQLNNPSRQRSIYRLDNHSPPTDANRGGYEHSCRVSSFPTLPSTRPLPIQIIWKAT